MKGIVRIRQAVEITGLSRSSIYSKVRKTSPYFDSTFPTLVQLGARSVGFYQSELENWIANLRKAV